MSINGATISVRSLSPFGERVGVRGLQTYREILTPHPTPLPAEVGFIRLRPLQMPNSGKPEFGGRGSRSSLPPNRIAYFAQAKATLSRVRVPRRSEERASALPPSAR